MITLDDLDYYITNVYFNKKVYHNISNKEINNLTINHYVSINCIRENNVEYIVFDDDSNYMFKIADIEVIYIDDLYPPREGDDSKILRPKDLYPLVYDN